MATGSCAAPPASAELLGTQQPKTASADETAEVISVACRDVVLEAERAGKDLAELSSQCHQKYGRGAFTVHFASMEDVREQRSLEIDQWLESAVRKSSLLSRSIVDGKVPDRLLDAARAFSCDCPHGDLGRRVIYRKADKLLDQLPQGTVSPSRLALEGYDPRVAICICAEVSAGSGDDIFTVAVALPTDSLVEKQRQQRQRWEATREHVGNLKALGNEEMRDREVGTEFAVKTYREAIRVLLESELEDVSLELPLRLNCAEALARTSQWKESEEECSRALAIEPNNVKALFRRGRARLKLGRAAGARADLTSAARMAPQDRVIRELLETAKSYTPPAVPTGHEEKPGEGAHRQPEASESRLLVLLRPAAVLAASLAVLALLKRWRR